MADLMADLILYEDLSGVVELDLSGRRLREIRRLPSSLRVLRMLNCHFLLEMCALPPALEVFEQNTMYMAAQDEDDQVLQLYRRPWGPPPLQLELPASLRVLRIGDMHISSRVWLPEVLEELQATICVDRVADLPSGLRVLDATLLYICTVLIRPPKGLEVLRLRHTAAYFSHVELPPALLELHLRQFAIKSPDLPPKLRRAELIEVRSSSGTLRLNVALRDFRVRACRFKLVMGEAQMLETLHLYGRGIILEDKLPNSVRALDMNFRCPPRPLPFFLESLRCFASKHLIEPPPFLHRVELRFNTIIELVSINTRAAWSLLIEQLTPERAEKNKKKFARECIITFLSADLYK